MTNTTDFDTDGEVLTAIAGTNARKMETIVHTTQQDMNLDRARPGSRLFGEGLDDVNRSIAEATKKSLLIAPPVVTLNDEEVDVHIPFHGKLTHYFSLMVEARRKWQEGRIDHLGSSEVSKDGAGISESESAGVVIAHKDSDFDVAFDKIKRFLKPEVTPNQIKAIIDRNLAHERGRQALERVAPGSRLGVGADGKISVLTGAAR